MAHLAIYRKWRPMTFDDIVGQEHITRTLKNQIMSGTAGHAYLFCGTRGTGKTTCAKVLSRAVNCLNPKDGNPCNECEICKGIADGSIMDVTEMDAASNNGVEDIRSIIEDVNYVASNSKYTVYIIDEVHMLSASAFNALLKTLEEPPENVIFILATTEAHKVPQTILSRCQKFDFRRIRNEDIIVRMKEIAYAEGYEISEEAYRMLASLAEGSMRDGLSVMERVIASSGNKIEALDIQNALGISSNDVVFTLTDAIISGDASKIITIIDKVLSDGKELSQLASSMLSHMRSLMLCAVMPEPERVMDCDTQTLIRYKEQSKKIAPETINRAMTLISEAMADARITKSSRVIYELAFLKLSRPEIDTAPEAIYNRLAAVEARVGAVPSAVSTTQSSAAYDDSEIMKRLEAVENAVKNGVIPKEEEKKTEPEPEKVSSARLFVPIPEEELVFEYPTAALARDWEKTLELMKQKNSAAVAPLRNCAVTFDREGIIVLIPEDRYKFTQPRAASSIDEIRKLFSKVTGTNYTVKIAKRGEVDPKNILNAFSLPRSGKEIARQDTPAAEPAPEEGNDKLGEFFDRFSNIITDSDKADILNTEDIKFGEQREITDEDIEREEFLEESELQQPEENEF